VAASQFSHSPKFVITRFIGLCYIAFMYIKIVDNCIFKACLYEVGLFGTRHFESDVIC